MHLLNRLRILASGLAIAVTFLVGSASLHGQQKEVPSIAPQANESTPNKWPAAQLITSTVSEAWQLSGKNEEQFFDIVQQLAAISAKNRGLMIPNNKAAGERAGTYIKQMVKADHNQLLYVIVDKAVQKVGTPEPHPAAKK